MFNDILAAFTTPYLADALNTASSSSDLHLGNTAFKT
jgi:hypothetical protein